MREQQKKQLAFLAKFFLVFIILQALILAVDLGFLENNLAKIEAGFLGLQAQDNSVTVQGMVFLIDANCTGLLSGAIVAAIVFSLKKPAIREKIGIFLAASVLLFLLNIPRIFVVLWAGKKFGLEVAELTHQITWFSTAAFILLFWYFLTKKIAETKDFSQLL